METTPVPSVLDLFAAPGGLSLGFKDAGYRICAVVDSDRWGCETLTHNLCKDGTLLIQSDIEDLQSKIRGRTDVVVGGPPCQSFSLVGRPKINHLRLMEKRKRFIDDRRNRLYKHFVSIVNEFRPQFFVMENVAGIISFKEGRVRDQILEDFEKIGYETDVNILNAATFGVPQVRNRTIFIGNRIGMKNPFPKRTHFDPLKRVQVKLEESGREWKPYLTVFDAISDLPPLQAGEGEDESEYPPVSNLTSYQRWAREGSTKLYNHVARNHSERDRELFRMLDPGQEMIDLPEKLRPYHWKTKDNQPLFVDKIKKQRWDRPSSTILAHMQKDGLMYVHPNRKQARSFTPREAARLQSFPDSYRFMCPLTLQFKQIGNAVPPILARAIALEIKAFLEPLKLPIVRYAE